MAKICFYCGKELLSGERCTCRASSTSGSTGSSSGASGTSGTSSTSRSDQSKNAKQTASSNRAKKESERQAKERTREQDRRARQTQRVQKPPFDWRSLLMKLMTSNGYSSSDPLPRKVGYSLLQTLFRPMTAIETFVQRQDTRLGLFYLGLFSLATGLVSLRFFGYNLLNFLEGTVLGLALALILNGLFILTLRFFAKTRFSFQQILSTFSASAFFMSLLFLFAGIGQSNLISFTLALVTGVVIGALLQFLSLKSLTRQSSDQLLIHAVFVYILFSSILGIILNLMVPAAATI